MYKILLTDDEQIMIESLSFIINKNFEGQVELFTASSGTKALELVTNNDIDIIFMDINMPGLSGLDTVSCILKLKPETIIIILSAFDRFQYAQDAMNLGVFKYITKPVNRNVVIQTIRSAMDAVDSKRGKQVAEQELNKKLDFVLPMIENDFIYSCLFSSEKNLDYADYFEYFDMKESQWLVLCLEFLNLPSKNQNEFYLRVRETINDVHKGIVGNFILNRMIVFMPVEEDIANLQFYQEIIDQFYKKLSAISAGQIRIGISQLSDVEKNTQNQSFYALYKQASAALSMCDDAGGFAFWDKKEEEIEIVNPENLDELKNQLLIRVRQGDFEGVSVLCSVFTGKLISSENEISLVKNKYFEIIALARSLAQESDKKYQDKAFDQVFNTLSNENNPAALGDFLKRVLLEYTEVIHTVKLKSENPIIVRICDYINSHLTEELSLEQMADYAEVSSFHLSKVFKEEMGVNYITFVTDKRLEMAQKLLKESQLSIKEITSEVGYNDQNYFSRLFKNKFGLSPSEYRK